MLQLDFIRKLPKLKRLSVMTSSINMSYDLPEETCDYMLNLVQACPYLCQVDKIFIERIPNIKYFLVCNSFKSQTPFMLSDEESTLPLKKLWPRMLSNATGGFARSGYHYGHGGEIDLYDAVYKLLVDGRGSFLQVLIDRSSCKEKQRRKRRKRSVDRNSKSKHYLFEHVASNPNNSTNIC